MTENQMLKADLHLHTRYSDGSDCLEKVVRKCALAGLQVISITDHFIAPNEELERQLEKKYGIRILSGIECGTLHQETGLKSHILGYGIKDYVPIMKLMKPVNESLSQRTRMQMGKLQEMGYEVTENEIWGLSDGIAIYRQQLNFVLWKKGQIPDMFGAWMKSMYRGSGPLNAEYYLPEPIPVIRAILEGGGYPVLAHPGQQKNLSLIPELAAAGLSGIEWLHPSNSSDDMDHIIKHAKEQELFLTGGSDYHGTLSGSGREIGSYTFSMEPHHILLKNR